MVSGLAAMVRNRVADLVCTVWLESVTLKVSDTKFAAAVGVPLSAPEVDRLSPAGSVPLVRDHVYGVVPPVAARAALYTAPT